MQQFPCPFCGPRDEREFHYVAEAGKVRPDTPNPINDADWSTYLYQTNNPKGESREVWLHKPCREMFIMTRDTVSMAVLSTEVLRKEQA